MDGTLAWAKAIGSEKSSSYTYGDYGRDIKVDADGNVYVVGDFMQNFDFNQDGVNDATGLTSNNNGFLAKLNSNGALQWVIPVVCTNSGSSATSLDLDSSGNIYFAGSYYHATTVSGRKGTTATLPEGNGYCNMYVMKVNSNGEIVWSRTGMSTGGDPHVEDIAVSADGYVYSVGYRCGITVNGTTYNSTSSYFDGFIMKLSTENTFEWFKETAGADYDAISSVVVDSSNNPIIVGSYANSSADITPGSTSITPHYSAGSYVQKLGPDGETAWYMNVSDSDSISCLYADENNNVYVGGFASGDNIYTSADGESTSTNSSHFLLKLDSAGMVQWNRQFGTNDSYNDSVVSFAEAPNGLRLIASVANDFDIDPSASTTYAYGTSIVLNYYVADWDCYTDVYNPAMAIFTFSSGGELTTFGSANTAPTLTGISTLTGATEDTDYTVTYDALATAADEADGDGDALSFRVESVISGTLKKGGSAVTPGATTLSSGESLVWTPAVNANGELNAFAVKAYDGTDVSGTAVQVKINVAAVNDAPVGQPTISGTAAVGQTLTAETSAITDADGLGTFSYQWQVSNDGSTGWSNIASASTGSTYAVTSSEAGQYVRVAVNYTDGGSTPETVYSAACGPNKTSQAALVYDGVVKIYGDANFTHAATGGSGSGDTTYTSSNTSVATIDSATGEVTILKAGTTTLTATRAGDVPPYPNCRTENQSV